MDCVKNCHTGHSSLDRYHAALTLVAALSCGVLLLPALLSQFVVRPKRRSFYATTDELQR